MHNKPESHPSESGRTAREQTCRAGFSKYLLAPALAVSLAIGASASGCKEERKGSAPIPSVTVSAGTRHYINSTDTLTHKTISYQLELPDAKASISARCCELVVVERFPVLFGTSLAELPGHAGGITIGTLASMDPKGFSLIKEIPEGMKPDFGIGEISRTYEISRALIAAHPDSEDAMLGAFRSFHGEGSGPLNPAFALNYLMVEKRHGKAGAKAYLEETGKAIAITRKAVERCDSQDPRMDIFIMALMHEAAHGAQMREDSIREIVRDDYTGEKIALLAQIAYGTNPHIGLGNVLTYYLATFIRETGIMNQFVQGGRWVVFDDFLGLVIGLDAKDVESEENALRAKALGIADGLSQPRYGKPLGAMLSQEDVLAIRKQGKAYFEKERERVETEKGRDR